MGLVWDKTPSSRAGTNTTITMSAASQATANFGSQTYQIRVATSGQPAFLQIGNSPTATSSSMLVGTNVVDYFQVTPGQAAAVLQAGTAGSIRRVPGPPACAPSKRLPEAFLSKEFDSNERS